MEVLARAQELEAQGRDIIHLEVGEPDFQAPSEALETMLIAFQRNLPDIHTPRVSFH